jgi:hypothetical protein
MDMRVVINRYHFEQLNDIEIFQNILPIPLAKISGKIGGGDQMLKEQLINAMTKGQQAIFMFMIIYFHNVAGWQLFLYGFQTEIKSGMLDKIKNGLNYLGDKILLSNFSQVETRYKAMMKIDPGQNLFEDLDIIYETIKVESFKNATKYIKTHENEFFIFKED